ncbi:thioesterase II family protein [Rugosimonospora africana]|uniref:Non-ribosomal peptide synthase n=1 Tax=Rugosimonospora africana TaxID=556532 RepID=A0A8J3VW59_9ACTN|nr:alpha/beta fold hydrolase [Rugosimonospora africana]GIH21402.1 non-ribosomal peptide synthase [Rugosimonospora africana]
MPRAEAFVAENLYVRRAARENPQYRLFCFPHAGAGVSTFASWPALLPRSIEVVAVQLPGREDRIRETAFADIKPLIRILALSLAPHLHGRFAFFGHSGGALMAFELARALSRGHAVQPAMLIVSGQSAPDLSPSAEPIHHLPDAEFIGALREIGGTTRMVVDDPDLMAVLLPALRADFTLLETYGYEPGPQLDMPIVAFGGRHDRRVPDETVDPWRRHTAGHFATQLFDGDHFYLAARPDEVTHRLADLLTGAGVSAEQDGAAS